MKACVCVYLMNWLMTTCSTRRIENRDGEGEEGREGVSILFVIRRGCSILEVDTHLFRAIDTRKTITTNTLTHTKTTATTKQ
ncbi:hypothetical protein F5H01DRAFT_88923 [Linnemannia elongata]|nr:hypothetical protein F5H01DRAFT_88923 [Linnemannia elongata]